MRRLFMWLLAAGLLLSVPVAAFAEPSIGQVLIREGDYAVQLSKALGVSTTDNEAEAESNLASLGIAPRSGWISDYPVTPDVIADLQTQVEAAAVAGRFLPTGKDDAVRAFVTLNTSLGLSVTPAASYQAAGPPDQGYAAPDQAYADQPAPAYPDQAEQDAYYGQAPPVVTYYAPPPDYAYLYNWNPFPFFFGGVLFPGFFVLADFSIALFNNPFIFARDEFVFFRHHHFDRHHFISNHFRDHDGHFARFDKGHRFDGRFDGRHDGRFEGRHDGRFEGRRGGFDRDSASRLVKRDFDRRGGGSFGRAREGAVRSDEGRVRRSWSGSSMPSRNDRAFRSESRGRSFGGESFRSVPSARSFGGGRSFGGERSMSRGFSSGRSFGGERSISRGFSGGGRSFSAPSMGSRSFGGGSRSSSSGGRSFGGGHGFGGGRGR